MHRAVGTLFGSVTKAVFEARASARERDRDDDDEANETSIRKKTKRGSVGHAGVDPEVRAVDASDGDVVRARGGAGGTVRRDSRGKSGKMSAYETPSGDARGGRGRDATDVKSTAVASRRGLQFTSESREVAGASNQRIEDDAENVMATTEAAVAAGDGTRKKGVSGLPVKSIDFEGAAVTPLRERVNTETTPSTSGRWTRGTPGASDGLRNALSPPIGDALGSPDIRGRVDTVVAGLSSDESSESEAETEELEDQDEDDDMGGTQDYMGATQVLDSAALCDAPSRFDLAVQPIKEEEEAPCARGGDAAIRLLRRRLFGVNRERPLGADGLDFAPHLKAHRDHLLNILEDTVSGGQNNSVLMVGNRGSGKSLVLNSALKLLAGRHPGKVVAVHLSGLLHADERIGMQKIAAQLCPNLNGESNGYASGGFAENVAFMTEMLKLLQGGQRGVIFVLDDFELFAMRSKQTLLYAITDLLQQPMVQAAVVGVTCRHSVDRLLEKRVASRFSNRRIVLAPPGNSVSMLEGVTKALKLSDKDKYLCPSEPEYVQQWNLHLHASMQNTAVKEKLEQYGRLENTPAAVSKVACAILSRVNRQLGKITSNDVVEAVDSMYRNPFVDSMVGSTPLELLLCVAMYRMHNARRRPSFTFEALTQELNDMGTREQLTHAKDCTRPVLVRAFENLLALGIATAHKSGSGARGAALKEYKNIVFVVDPEELREAIRRHPNAVSGLADYMDHESLRQAHVV